MGERVVAKGPQLASQKAALSVLKTRAFLEKCILKQLKRYERQTQE